MVDKKKQSGRSLFKYLFLVPQLFGVVRGVLYKLKLETYFTIKNLIILVLLALALVCLLIATWVSILAILFFSLLQWQWSWYTAALVVMLIQLIGLMSIGVFIVKIKNRLENSAAFRHLCRKN